MLLNKTSPRLAVDQVLLPLKPHQEAIVKACIDVEERIYADQLDKAKKSEPLEPFGILAAPVGCGKTLCILSMILLDSDKQNKGLNWWSKFKKIFEDVEEDMLVTGATLVVVPSHLYEQWDDAITKFIGKGKLKVHKFKEYADVSRLYREDAEENMLSINMFLVSSLYYQTVATLLLEIRVTFRRLVFDEADSISDLIRFASPAIVTWFVSASIASTFNEKSGLTLGSHASAKQKKTVETYHVSPQTLAKVTVDVDRDFIKESWKLPDIVYTTLHTEDSRDEAVSVMIAKCDRDLRESIISCDWRRVIEVELLGKRVKKVPKNEVELLLKLEKGWAEIKKESEDEKERVSTMEDERIRDDIIERENAKIEKMDRKLRGKKEIGLSDQEFFKISEVVELCRDVQVSDQTLIFSSVFQTINEIDERFKRLNIKFADLDGGSESKMARALSDFNKGSYKILLCYSARFSCGANLEATSRIIFMHDVPQGMRDQVIGRAQRPGRVSSLEVIDLKYSVERHF
jgi:superfamily II DNA or RNA helicase